MGLGKTYSTQYLLDSNNNSGAANEVLISTSTGVNWTDVSDIIGGPYLPLAGGTMTGTSGVIFPDDFKLNLGTGSDLEIYHDGSNSYIKDTGTGSLIIQSSDLFLRTNSTENAIVCAANASVTLYYNNVSKLATTSTGVTVAGAISADDNIYLDGAAPVLNVSSSNNASGFRINVTGIADSTNNLLRVQRSGTTMIDTRGNGDTTFTAQAFSAATSSGDASSTLTTKGYVDSLITGATIYRGTWDPDVSLNSGYGNPNLNTVTQTSGYYYICSADGAATPNGATTEPNTWNTGDWVIWNDDIGASGEWQKIDNSSVLSGVGTGQTVALWEGASSVTDSETLGNAPITVSGNNAIFAGDINLAAGKKLQYSANSFMTPENNVSGAEISTAGTFIVKTGTTPTLGLTLDASQNATFAGNVTLTGDLTGTDATFSSLTIDYYKAAFAGDIELNGANKYIYFRTGTDSGLWQEDNFSLRFGTNNVERMRIDSSGNVGIGVTPSNTQAITTQITNGLSLFGNNSTPYGFISNNHAWTSPGGDQYLVSNYGASYYKQYEGAHSWATAPSGTAGSTVTFTTRMTILSGGNVGIGTDDPTRLLQLNSSGQTDLHLTSTNQGVGASDGMTVFLDSSGTGGLWLREAQSLRFATNSSEKMTILSGGNVGIGTTSPSTKLHVTGSVEAGAYFDDSNATRLLNPGGGSNNSLGNGATPGAIKIRLPQSWTSTMMRMTIKVYEYEQNESFTVRCGGYNYGTGSTWISEFAYIESQADDDRNFTVRFGHDGTKCCIYIGELTSVWQYPKVFVTDFQAGFSNTSGLNWDDGWEISMETTAFGTISGTITNTQVNNWQRNGQDVYYGSGSGNVGIGTTAPSQKLHISGNMRLTGAFRDRLNSQGAANYVLTSTGSNGTQWVDASGSSIIGGPYLPLSAGASYPLTDTLYITTTNQHIRLNNGSELGIVHLLSSGELEFWGHGDGETINFRTGSGTGTIAMNVVGTNVGIGTTSPQKNLQIFQAEGGIGVKHATIRLGGYSTVGPDIAAYRVTGNSNDQGLIFSTYDATNGTVDTMTLTNDGNVGIGTTSPGYKLDVRSSLATIAMFDGTYAGIQGIQVQRNGGDNVRLTANYSGYGGGLESSDALRFSVNGADISNPSMYIETTGNVGIGTTSPSTDLQVIGTVRADVFGVQDDSTNPSGNTSTRVTSPAGATYDDLSNSASTGIISVIFPTTAVSTMLSFTLRVFDYANNESFDVNVAGYWYGSGLWTNTSVRIESQGNVERNFNVRFGKNNTNKGWVGVGETTTSWSYVKFAVLNFQAAHVNDDLERWDDLWDTAVLTSLTGYTTLVTKNNNQVNNWARNGEDLYYGSGSGNVGIGTTGPSIKLEVSSSGAEGILISKDTGTTSNSGRLFFETDTVSEGFSFLNSNGLMTIRSQAQAGATSGNVRVAIDGSGNVGIGTTIPGYKLDVTGTIRATGDVIAYSDVRVKENIKTIDNSLEKVSKLRGVEFNKIGDNEKSIGVIAQEIEKVIPEVVKEDDKGMKSVAYGNISGLLIEAIKELKAEIEELKSNKCNCNK